MRTRLRPVATLDWPAVEATSGVGRRVRWSTTPGPTHIMHPLGISAGARVFYERIVIFPGIFSRFGLELGRSRAYIGISRDAQFPDHAVPPW
jgi:hypothetical protein